MSGKPLEPICYVVPSWEEGDATHMAHLPRFLGEVGKRCELHVVIQRGRALPAIPEARSVALQRPGNRLRRACELARIARDLRAKGCRKFFVRISMSAAWVLNSMSKRLDLRVYHWLSGQDANFPPTWGRSPWRRLRFELADRLAGACIRRAHRLVTGPESMAEYYARAYGVDPGRIVVLYNDIDLDAWRARLPPDRAAARAAIGEEGSHGIVLFVGRVSPLKGGHNLLPFAARLRELDPAAKLCVVGDLGHIPGIARRLQEAGAGNIRLFGPVANHLLAPFFRAADVFLLPSESEGFPRRLLEAMACRTPVAAFDVGGVRDILHPAQLGFVVPRGDVRALAERAARLLGDAALREEQSRAGWEMVQQYSTEKVARMFVERIVMEPE